MTGETPVLHSEGISFPVEVRYAEHLNRRPAPEQAVEAVVEELVLHQIILAVMAVVEMVAVLQVLLEVMDQQIQALVAVVAVMMDQMAVLAAQE